MPAEIDALNYPYIRVRSVDWLKRTLLIFPHVVRMTPFRDAPADDPEIAAFTDIVVREKPLLRAADLQSRHVYEALRELITELKSRLEVEGTAFLAGYSRDAARESGISSIGGELTVWERRLSPNATFQIHAYKLFEDLAGFLRDAGLAWQPDSAFADGPDYLEMHPQLGEAVMATLATTCAENEGLEVVTEFPELHGKLLGGPREKILSACLDGMKSSGRTSERQIAEFFVYRHCDVEMLSAENIVALKKERDALADFRGKLEDLARTLPPVIYGEKHLAARIESLLEDMFEEWRKDQKNLSPVARRFFGEGMSSEIRKAAEKMVEAALKPEIGPTVAAGAAAGGLTGSFGHVLTGVGAGFAVAVVFREYESWRQTRDAAEKSPLRYLTRLQDQGVAFSFTR